MVSGVHAELDTGEIPKAEVEQTSGREYGAQ